MEWIGPLTVTQRVALGLATAAVLFLLVVFLVGLLIGWWRSLALCVGLVVVAVGGLLLMPLDTAGLTSHPDPVTDYDAAMAKFETDLATAPEPLNPLCDPYVLTHGQKADKVVVLLHGVSSCPQAYVDFAPQVFERGHNVMVVRMPQNGHADRGTDALNRITAEELAAFADTVVDTAAGLGDEVVFFGISAGGTVAGWAAQNRPEVTTGVLVAPFFALGGTNMTLNAAATRAMLLMPDVSLWRDPVLRENYTGGMPHAYLRQSTRGAAEIMRLGAAVFREAEERAPAARQLVVVTNDADTAVANSVTDRLVADWRAKGADVVAYEFDRGHRLGHEIVDPLEPNADTGLTYPVLLQLIEDPAGFDPASVPAPGR